jgi:hypothetical protein
MSPFKSLLDVINLDDEEKRLLEGSEVGHHVRNSIILDFDSGAFVFQRYAPCPGCGNTDFTDDWFKSVLTNPSVVLLQELTGASLSSSDPDDELSRFFYDLIRSVLAFWPVFCPVCGELDDVVMTHVESRNKTRLVAVCISAIVLSICRIDLDLIMETKDVAQGLISLIEQVKAEIPSNTDEIDWKTMVYGVGLDAFKIALNITMALINTIKKEKDKHDGCSKYTATGSMVVVLTGLVNAIDGLKRYLKALTAYGLANQGIKEKLSLLETGLGKVVQQAFSVSRTDIGLA